KLQITNAITDADANYKWYVNGQLASDKSAFELNIDQASELAVSLQIDNKYGCSDSAAYHKTIKISAPLQIEASIAKSNLCAGDVLNLEENNSGINYRTVLWGDGNADTTLRTLSHSYQTAGEFEIQVVAKNTIAGCVDTFTVPSKVVVNALPKANFSVNMEGTCTPQILEFNNQSSGVFTTYSLVIDNFDTLSFDDAKILKEPGLHEVRLKLTNEKAGCKAEAVQTFELFNPINSAIKPSVLETKLENTDLAISWKGISNSKYYEIYAMKGGDSSLLVTTTDTAYTVAGYAKDSDFAALSIKAYDQCGASSAYSQPAQAMALKGAYQTDSFPTLQWNAFDAWGENLAYYQVERNEGNGWVKAGISHQPHFIDRSFNNNQTLEATYRVSAVYTDNLYQSTSTTYTFEFEPNIFIPSAFSPNYDNVNDRYEIKGYGMKECDIQIFNKWGEMVFDSNGQNIAWDGTYKGEMVEAGVYICVVEMQTPSGQTYNMQQTITLIK
ncbi:T9SS type B sorting domain-containing protein, partial [bacterium]|nr:T9SS type B sorting domain-containing protein [bacterium]